MAIRFRCLHCRKLLSIGTRKARQRIACPICRCQQIVPDGSPKKVQFSVRAGISPGDAVPRGNFPAPPWLPPLISGISGFVRSKPWPLAMVGLGLALFLAVGIAVNRNPAQSPVFSKEAQTGRNTIPDERITKPATAFSQPPSPAREVTLVAENPMGRHRPSSLRFDEDPLTESKPGQAAKEEPASQKKKLLSPPVPLAIPPAKESIFKRRQHRTAEELRQQLLKVPQVALDSVPQTSSKLLAEARLRGRVASFPGPALLLSQRPDLAGLPFARGLECMLGKEPAEALHVLAPKLRTCIQAAVPETGNDFRLDTDRLGQELLGDETRRGAWLRSEAVPALVLNQA